MDEEKRRVELVRVRKLLSSYKKNITAFNKIIEVKFGGNTHAVDDISKLLIANIKVCMICKARLDDNPIPTTKKDLLDRWRQTKHR